MRQLFLLLILFSSPFVQAQTPEENLDKYWKYRDRLRKDFLKIGNLPGESIPMSARSIGFAYSGVPNNANGDKPSRIYYQDATIYLGHYLAVLATEAKLLLNNYNATTNTEEQQALLEQLESTKNELYYAIQTVNRLDLNAEKYLSQSSNPPSTSDLNGLLLRDDVPENFHDKFLNDYSEIFERECDFQKTHSDYKPLRVWSTDENGNPVTPGEQVAFNGGNMMSLDQITTLFTGLRCVYDLIEDEVVMPSGETTGINLKQEAKAIVHRILDYVVKEETTPGTDPAYSFTIRGVDGRMDRAGSDMFADAPFIFGIGRHFDYPLFNEWVNEGLGNIRVAVMVDSPTLLEQVLAANYFVCRNDLIDRLIEKGNEPINVATISLGQLLILVDELQEQSIEFITGHDEICVDFTNEITEAWVNLDINVQGMLCDNSGATLNGYFAAVVPLILSSMVPIVGDLLAGTILFAESVAAVLMVTLIVGGWLYLTMEEPEICLSQISDDPTPQALKEDNVHILQELGTISGRWTPEYVNSMDHPSGLDYYTMLRAVLEPTGTAISLLNSSYLKAHFLDTAPCEGPWAEPNFMESYQDPQWCSTGNWASQNRLFHADNAQFGSNDRSFRGEFSGLDFMLYYNLYHLLWPDELPIYTRIISCQCIEEITNATLHQTNLEVNRKFEDYKSKGIPIESFLAHSIVVDGATMDVKNDLVICREDPELVTSLQLSNEANLVLFGGNTIEVREGNMIVLNNSTLTGAIIDPTDPTYTESTIHFKAGAEFHILNGSELILSGGLTIIMDEGSKLIIDDSDVTALESLYSNHLIIHGDETVVQLHNNSHYQSGAPVHWEFSDNASLSIRNSLVQSNQDHWSFHNQCSVSISHNSQCYFVNSTQQMTANGAWNINNSHVEINSSIFTIDTGSELHTSATTFIIRDAGQVLIKNVFPNQQASHYYFDESTDLQIKGSESKLVFHGGKLHIPENQIFTFTYPNAESGFIEVLAGTENMLHTGNNSVFLLVGEGSEDLMLRIAPGAHIQNPNFSAGSMIFRDALVDMEGGAIYTDMFFKAEGVNFNSAGSAGNIWIWYSQAQIQNCRFQNIDYFGMWSKFVVKHCRHFDMEYNLYGGGYDFYNNTYSGCNGQSSKLQLASVMLDCKYDGPTSDYFYSDESLVEVYLRECTFEGQSDNTGVSKMYGKLSLRCSEFVDCAVAIHGLQASVINMSLSDNAGSNKFTNCGTMVLLDDAYDLDIFKGANDFSDVADKIFSGNIIAYECDMFGSSGCAPELDAIYNTWPGGSGPPAFPLIDIQGEGTPCGGANYPDCSLVVVDNSPALPQDCGSNKPIIDIHKSNTAGALISGGPANEPHNSGLAKNLQGSNPYLNTDFFQGVPLDSALVYAAGLSSIVDSLGNDSLAIELFHQILTAGLDRTNAEIRWKMLWGLRNMKTATEQLIIHGFITPENNTSIFHSIVQQYVDVLNLMTDDEIVDSTYKEQYYFELNKGQLFRSIANPWMALEIFDQLDQCDLDLPEQDLLNQIIAEVNGEIATLQSYETGIALDSLIFLPDSAGMIIPQPYSGSNYYFGAYLVSPTEVYYMACAPQIRAQEGHSAHMQVAVYPNPNNGQFAMIYEGEEGPCQLSINDSYGRLVYMDQNPLQKNERRQIHLNRSMAAGIYFLELKTLQGVYRKQLMIEN